VQDARRQAGLDVSDRIVLGISGSEAVDDALERFRDYLMSETLAVDWVVGQTDALLRDQRTLDHHDWTIEISRAG
jgi:isoleucyl-tRNA synthetase